MDCLFCKIIKGEIPAKIVHRNESLIAFEDIHPQAPHHLLIIPQKHINTLNDLDAADNALMGQMVQTAKMLAKNLDIDQKGYRLVMNCNALAGQTVFHIHLHMLGGRQMMWPPG